MKKINFLLAVLTLGIGACKKEAGEGGDSSVKGKILVKDYNSSFTSKNGEYDGADEDVYIIYGDDVSFGDRERASYNGMYEFKYLRPGKYKIYAYSKDSSGAYINQVNLNAPPKAVIQEVEITKSGQVVEVPLITVLD